MNLHYLTDQSLLQDTKTLAQEYRLITAKLLHYLIEIETRKLYSELGYTSLFTYIVQELGFSEASASRRITAMKLLVEIPEIEGKIESGDLTLSNIGKAVSTFKKEGITDTGFKKEILASIENTSAATCEKALTEIISASLPTPPPPPSYVLSFSLKEETYQKYQELRSLLAPYKMGHEEFFAKVFEISIEHYTKKKLTSKLKKEIYERDKSCQQCGSLYALEFDHIFPLALGGENTKENLRILCRNCNQRKRIVAKL